MNTAVKNKPSFVVRNKKEKIITREGNISIHEETAGSKATKYFLIGISALFLFVMLVLPLITVITEAFRRGNQAIFMGNGGSSADAQHISAELSGKYLFHRPALPGVCLSNIAPVTAVGNDYSYAEVFREVRIPEI